MKLVLSDRRVASAIPATTSPDRARGDAGVGQPPFFGDEERGYVRRQARTG